MIQVTLNSRDLQPILVGPPKINDQLEAVCRTMEFSVRDTEGLENYPGQKVELWYNGSRWFVGFLRKRGRKHDGVITYLVYDPLIFLVKNIDDWYFTGVTATQGIKTLAEKSGIRIKNLANTGVVLPPLYYQGKAADAVAIDQLSRTYQKNKKKFWFNYKPDHTAEGLDLFERVIPSKLWAFQVGVNLTGASYEESIEDTITVVKLVNRDTGKIVTRIDDVKLKAYGKAVHFEEVDKDEATTMETKAQTLLKNLAKLNITQQIEGINPDGIMPQLYSGDYIYAEEKYTRIIGGYHVRNITHSFENSNLISISADLEVDPYVPEIQFTDAEKKPNTKESTTGVQQNYSPELKKVMSDYGI